MYITCLDMEGVLVPEIWIAFAEASGIPALKRTTRDEPDYHKLMEYRLGILREHGLGLREIQATIAQIDPLPGARAFLDELRSFTQVHIPQGTRPPVVLNVGELHPLRPPQEFLVLTLGNAGTDEPVCPYHFFPILMI